MGGGKKGLKKISHFFAVLGGVEKICNKILVTIIFGPEHIDFFTMRQSRLARTSK